MVQIQCTEVIIRGTDDKDKAEKYKVQQGTHLLPNYRVISLLNWEPERKTECLWRDLSRF